MNALKTVPRLIATSLLLAPMLVAAAPAAVAATTLDTPEDATGVYRYLSPADLPAQSNKARKAKRAKHKELPPTNGRALSSVDKTNNLPLDTVTGRAVVAPRYQLVPLSE